MSKDDLHLTRLSVADLAALARDWRERAWQGGDRVEHAIAEAMESVVRQRRATEQIRARITAVRAARAGIMLPRALDPMVGTPAVLAKPAA